MRKKVGQLCFVFVLLAACGTPLATRPTETSPSAQLPGITATSKSFLKITSTPDERTGSALAEGQPACQITPATAHPGSTVNISIFNMPVNQQVSIHLLSEVASTHMTDDNGYMNTDLVIPADISMGLHLVSVTADGTDATAECVIRIWTELSPTPTSSSQQLSLTATHGALLVQMEGYCRDKPVWDVRLSPNGEWVAVFCSFDTLEFVRLDETKNWELSADTLINPYADYFIGVVHWSGDAHYVYVRLDPHTDGYWEPFHQGIVLYQLDLEAGTVSETLALEKDHWIFYSFAFSPDDKWLAYIATDRSPVVLNLRDLQTGVEQSFAFDSKYNTGGAFVWSPDGEKLAFSVTQYDLNTAQYIGTSIMLWDRQTSEVTELIEDHPGRVQVIEWVDELKIILQAEMYEPTQLMTQKYEFDLATQALTEIDP